MLTQFRTGPSSASRRPLEFRANSRYLEERGEGGRESVLMERYVGSEESVMWTDLEGLSMDIHLLDLSSSNVLWIINNVLCIVNVSGWDLSILKFL